MTIERTHSPTPALNHCSKPQPTTTHNNESIANIKHLVETLHANGITTTKFELDILLAKETFTLPDRTFDPTSINSCCNFEKLHRGEYTFTDLRTNITYTIDPIKTSALMSVLNDQLAEKSVSFSVSAVSFHDMQIEPLTTSDYKSGLPFLLSCETRHCDFIGGFGGNYPLAEYLSPDGISCKITRAAEYVGHVNAWKDNEGNILLGTLAMKQEEVKTNVLRQTLELFSKSLLENNPDTHKILLGMGGQNLSILFSDHFIPGGEGHSPLGKIRHEDDIIQHAPIEVKKLELLTGMDVYGQVNINNQDSIGMSPNNRLDMKNAVIFMDDEKAKTVDAKASALLEEIQTKGAYREQKNSRTTTWQEIQHRGDSHRLEKFHDIKNHLLQLGITDVRLERSQGQDLTISTPQKPQNLPYPVLDGKQIDDRFFTKVRVGGQRP
ncbi:hypothetical protein [Pseudomonas sp. SDO5591_S426]